MKIYQVEVGATYWVVAKSLRQAFDTVWRCWEEEQFLEELDEGGTLSIDEVSEIRARKIQIVEDGKAQTLWSLGQEFTEPLVVGCSEWP